MKKNLTHSQKKKKMRHRSALSAVCALATLISPSILAEAPSHEASGGAAQSPQTASDGAVLGTSAEPTLFVIPYAHLDTQWRWDYSQTIGEFLPKTMRDNFALFEKYPHYIFNFSGANRYRLMKEYYPQDYERMKQYIAADRWFPAGSSMEEGDVNSPSAESIFRQILYGKEYFRREFGKTSAEYMIPDCFGFPASLPSILAHAGIKGFSTQKLTWHSGARTGGPNSPQGTPEGIPFNVGFWQGPDGKGVVAALNATSYSGDVTEDLTSDSYWVNRAQKNGASSGLYFDYRYYGTGDTGGAPSEESVRRMEAILTKGSASLTPAKPREENSPTLRPGPLVKMGEGPLHVVQTTAEDMFLRITPEQAAQLPHYSGDLELIEHSAGSLTSEAYLKRWNRKNELLADAAERASVAAEWLGGRPYPLDRLTRAWTLVMGGQFHDILPGTATPKSYEYSWNDEVLAMNQFADVLTDATESISSGLDTEAKGTPIVVYNPLNIAREDVVEAKLPSTTQSVRVLGPDGKEVPSQIATDDKGQARVLFLAKAPSVGYTVYDIQPGETSKSVSPLKVSESSLENERYTVKLDSSGDISSIFDKHLKKELLSAPIRLAISEDKPVEWPAWNMDWADQQRAPRSYVQGSPKIRVVENGPVRVAVEIRRETEGSVFVQTVRLSAGDAGNRVEFANAIDWRTKEANLKAVFPLTASNNKATYNWDVGTIERTNNDEKKYEVPSHQWFDLTNNDGGFGVTVLTDCKNGSDKPADNVLRLTLLRTPGISEHGQEYSDQATQDWGHHEFVYGVTSHLGDWRKEKSDWQGWRLNQPLIAFSSDKHKGGLGKSFSLLNVNNSRVRVLALKKAEQSEEIVVRLVELDGSTQKDVHVTFPAAIATAREINASEEPVGSATIDKDSLVTDFTAYQPRTFALKLVAPSVQLERPSSQPVALDYDRSVATFTGKPSAGSFDNEGRAWPADALPAEISYNGIKFHLAPAGAGTPDAVTALGQTISLPEGPFNRVYLLAASAESNPTASFKIGDQSTSLTIEDWTGKIGQWDDRKWKEVERPTPAEPAAGDNSPDARRARRIRERVEEHGPLMTQEYTGLTPGFIKSGPVAWYLSHLHRSDGSNEPYAYSYLFAYPLEVPSGAKTITLPYDKRIRILAISAVDESGRVQPAQILTDNLADPTKVAEK
jgi:alpha-mannosidase